MRQKSVYETRVYSLTHLVECPLMVEKISNQVSSPVHISRICVNPHSGMKGIKMYSDQQRSYLAHWLTLSSNAEDSPTKTIASARVDMNPHQVEAAMFALASPLSNGVILADEVGLGKTIEASLILAQKWAERRRRLLLITRQRCVSSGVRNWKRNSHCLHALSKQKLQSNDQRGM